jgi:hypothetical protein
MDSITVLYPETDADQPEMLQELDILYRVHHYQFGLNKIEPNYLTRRKPISEAQKQLLAKIVHLSRAEVIVSVQGLMESIGVNNPLTLLNTMLNLSELGLINNFEWPDA